MPDRFYTYPFLLLLFLCSFTVNSSGYTGCPGCLISLPPLPTDTIYTDSIQPGNYGMNYEADISFRMPKTTTPVNAVDPSIPAGIALDEIIITSLTGLPAGLDWEASQYVFNPNNETDGCIRFCGVPLQTGTFIIEINIEADIFLISQQSKVVLSMVINPPVSNSDGFSMINGQGCGELEVSFVNNIPSNGQAGFSYIWNFDNGYTTTDENPYNQLYTEAGSYVVSYTAVIDTIGFLLNSVNLTKSPCTDLFSQADPYIHIRNPDGLIIYTTPDQTNASLPVNFLFGDLPIGPGQYTLEVWDEDGGVDGSDDLCGIIPFTRETTGSIDIGSLAATFNIAHPFTTITAVDTIIVFPHPEPPLTGILEGSNPHCPGQQLVLGSTYIEGNQWYMDSTLLVDETNQSLSTTESGQFWLVYTDLNGCQAVSDTLTVTLFDNPPQPFFYNDDNLLLLDTTLMLPAAYSLQWFLNGMPLEGADNSQWCARESGVYTLIITDLQTGCSNNFSQEIPFNPNGNCVTSTQNNYRIAEPVIFPNPAEEVVHLNFPQKSLKEEKILLFDSFGRNLQTWQWPNGVSQLSLPIENVPTGIYYLRINGIIGGWPLLIR